MAQPPDRHDYQVAIICALKTEADAVESIFDEFYAPQDAFWQRTDGDQISYTLGRIGKHHVVLAHMPGLGKVNAAITASSIRATFPNISKGLTLVVGICAGAPQTISGESIFLGDVLVSTSIQQADFGRDLANSFVPKDHAEGNLGAAPIEIMSFLGRLQTRTILASLHRKTSDYSLRLIQRLGCVSPDASSDMLFSADYLHKHHGTAATQCPACTSDAQGVCEVSQRATCVQLGCHSLNLRLRPDSRTITMPAVYFGSVCSTDAVKRNGLRRDELITRHDVIGFEMEGAGVWKILPSLVVKSVCDYADSHKNKQWQEISAINAAACCRAIVEEWTLKTHITSSASSLFGPVFTQSIPSSVKANSEASAQKKGYLESLRYSQVDSRLHDIKFAYPGTCDWILQTSEFRHWLNPAKLKDHHGILWIKGKPGSGKSVIMKHVFHARHLFKDSALAAYFFHARGTAIQHNMLGLYRSLVYQLVAADDALLDKFIAAFPSRAEQDSSTRPWAESELQHFLLLCTRQGWIKRTTLFIDALDECDYPEAREIVSFCEDLAMNAIRGPSRLLICLSIRHFPNISVQRCIQIDIDQRMEHTIDIGQYVWNKSLNKEIVPEICEKAHHIFLWATLVVHMLNEAHDRGSDLQSMRSKLASIPPGLNSVFQSLLEGPHSEGDDPTLMFQLVSYAFEPLSPNQLYLMANLVDQSEADLLLDVSESTDEARWMSMLSKSRGLLERRILPGTNNIYIVQFIHESVRDYLGHRSADQDDIEMDGFPPASECHAIIAQRCINVLKLVFSSEWASKYDPQAAGKRFNALTRVEYARRRVQDHLAAVRKPVLMEPLIWDYAHFLSKEEPFAMICDIVSHWAQRWDTEELAYRQSSYRDESTDAASLELLKIAAKTLSIAERPDRKRTKGIGSALRLCKGRGDMSQVLIEIGISLGMSVEKMHDVLRESQLKV